MKLSQLYPRTSEKVRAGDLLKLGDMFYVVSYTDCDRVALISPTTGRRWTDPTKVRQLSAHSPYLAEECVQGLIGSLSMDEVEYIGPAHEHVKVRV